MEWIEFFGPEFFILSADSRDGLVVSNAWQDQSEISIQHFIANYCLKGIQNVTCTDVSKDGLLSGPSIELYQSILKFTNCNLTASGGISSLNDLHELRNIGCHAAIVGKAIYENRISLAELVQFNNQM